MRVRGATDTDPNIRRAASEGLRGIVKTSPEQVWPILDLLRADSSLYVKKSVANVLRNASAKHPDQVLRVCRRWLTYGDTNTNWIVNDGLRTLRTTHAADVDEVWARRALLANER
jgi:3-methyladenine DNA glycosylase AlkC